MPNVLLVSLNFPPSQIASVHRVRHLAKHLPAFGWHPIVLAVDERLHKEPPDLDLGKLVPESVDVRRIGAIPLNVTTPFGLSDLGIRSVFHLAKAIDRLVAEARPSIVFFTGSPFYQMLLTARVRKRHGIPVVLDFQDPWVSMDGATYSKWSKAGLSHALAVMLEPRAARHAAYFTSVSDIQNAQMAARYPWLDASSMAAIPIGGDPDDFDALRSDPPTKLHVQLDPTRINLSYVGTYLPRAGPLMQVLFQAVRRLKQAHPELAAKLRLNFVGTSNQPTHVNDYRIRPLAEAEGISELVSETPQRLPFLEALHILANSHGLLLIGSDEPHYTASKIYPALMSGRPYVSLFHRQSSAHDILMAAGGGTSLCFDTPSALAALVEPLKEAIVELATQPEQFKRADPAAYEAFTARSTAGRFAKVFAEVALRSDR